MPREDLAAWFQGIFKPRGGFGARLPPWDAASVDLGVENQQQGGGPDLVGHVQGVIAPLCFMTRGMSDAGAAGAQAQWCGTG